MAAAVAVAVVVVWEVVVVVVTQKHCAVCNGPFSVIVGTIIGTIFSIGFKSFGGLLLARSKF